MAELDLINELEPRYSVGGQTITAQSAGFRDVVAAAHSNQIRPRCMCQPDGVEMYIGRLGGSYLVKRMPDTGSLHATDCNSYQLPAEATGLDRYLGTAIAEDPTTGETRLKLDFPLTRHPGRIRSPTPGASGDSAKTDSTRLSLRGLLYYLWDQAGLTYWHPRFEGKRNWGTVRRLLLQTAAQMTTSGVPLLSRLYIPEPFSPDQRDAIDARRRALWSKAAAPCTSTRHLMLLIAELREISPAHIGHRAIVKHMPDLAFGVDETLFRRLGRKFEEELALWAATDDLRMIIAATFEVRPSGAPQLQELTLMTAVGPWIPTRTGEEEQVRQALRARRALSQPLDLSG